VWVSGSTSRLCAAGLGLLLGLGTATAVNAAADDLEEIVVTGSHIRGADVAGSKLIVISVEQIEASGNGRVGDVLATVPQNFNRANEAVGEPGFFNLNHGSEVQLRGLGVGTTLTLVNGQRQGASGWQGTFTDVSTIPVSAINAARASSDPATALNIFRDGSPTRSSISGSTTLSTSTRPSSTSLT
jgi:iron complex outermembrane recepter protein